MVLDTVERGAAEAALRRWWSSGFNKHGSLATEATIEESFLAFFPFVRVRFDLAIKIMMKDSLSEASETHGGANVTKIEDAVSIRRPNGLFEHHQEVIQTRLPRTVGSKEDSQRCQFNASGVLPSLEVLNT